jgi:flavin reductase (DIM6/NTAB) family NADH-FMN oxidoreductase RutF
MRVPVELRRAYRLLNHGATTLVTAAHEGRRNIMAAAWVMPLDFDPPKLVAVISSDTYTRALVEASRELVIQLPTVAMIDLAYAVGTESGRDEDKFAKHGIGTSPAAHVAAPLVEGCAAWLECRVANEPEIASKYDLLVCEVVAAWADDRSWVNGEWRFAREEDRTVHHLTRGTFYATGAKHQVA